MAKKANIDYYRHLAKTDYDIAALMKLVDSLQSKIKRLENKEKPPFPKDTWCKWCAGTGHPYGDESKGICKCPDRRKEGK